MAEVYNMRRKEEVPPGAIYVGRPTRWGNPFFIGQHGSRAQVIERYRKWVWTQPNIVSAARRELRGKDLVCWCAPKTCHADVLMEIAAGAKRPEET